jgi:tricorn protease
MKITLALVLLFFISAGSQAQGTRLLRHPTVSRDSVAFEYAGDLWIVARSGGTARRLTSTPSFEVDPYFSPDGSQIAFSATVAGNTDVYVVPTAGGDPKRLTYHPGIDRVRGWKPDGKSIIFASNRTGVPQQSYMQLWTINVDGGLPEMLRSSALIHRTALVWLTKNSRRLLFRSGLRRACGVTIAVAARIRSRS